jgi:hypothetical protein
MDAPVSVGRGGASGTAGSGGTAGSPGSPAGSAGTSGAPDASLPFVTTPLPVTDAGLPVVAPATEDACRSSAIHICHKIRTCRPASFSVIYADDEECRVQSERTCRLGLVFPGVGDTPARVAACADAIKDLNCDQWNLDTAPAACTVPAGTLPDGAACNVAAQCQAGSSCKFDPLPPGTAPPPTRCGRCARRPTENQPCDFNGTLCAAGHICISTGTTPTPVCLRTRKAGDACTGRDICEFPSACIQDKCQASYTLREGDPCRNVTQRCDIRLDLYCNGLTGTCQRRMQAARPGQPCGTLYDGSNTFVDCEPTATCTGVSQGGFVSVCVARVGEGEACTTTTPGPRCKVGLVCGAGKCARAPDVGGVGQCQ